MVLIEASAAKNASDFHFSLRTPVEWQGQMNITPYYTAPKIWNPELVNNYMIFGCKPSGSAF
jgi:hypothetical protein